MDENNSSLSTISDTALWAAVYRARESERPNPVFNDPYAKRLTGRRGESIAASMSDQRRHSWAWVTRTLLFDRLIARQVERGVDLVVNLAAGLDARPYRMDLPADLLWVEVDFAPLLDYKSQILREDQPRCRLERVPLDLSDQSSRRDLFEALGKRAERAVVVTEGFLIYLTEEEVTVFGKDLAAPAAFRDWIIDIGSPGLLAMMQQELGERLGQANAALKFAPKEGPDFFRSAGWKPVDIRPLLKNASRAGLLNWKMKLLSLLPEPKGQQGPRPWSAVGLLERL